MYIWAWQAAAFPPEAWMVSMMRLPSMMPSPAPP